MGALLNFLNEVKETQIRVGDSFVVAGDIGIFTKGQKVTVIDKRPSGNDIVLTLENEQGEEDTFYLDKNDDFNELV